MTTDVLRRVRDLLSTPDRWGSHNSKKLTLDGAVFIATATTAAVNQSQSRGRQSRARLGRETTALLERIVGADLCEWNDAPERTHADVLAAIDAALAAG